MTLLLPQVSSIDWELSERIVQFLTWSSLSRNQWWLLSGILPSPVSAALTGGMDGQGGGHSWLCLSIAGNSPLYAEYWVIEGINMSSHDPEENFAHKRLPHSFSLIKLATCFTFMQLFYSIFCTWAQRTDEIKKEEEPLLLIKSQCHTITMLTLIIVKTSIGNAVAYCHVFFSSVIWTGISGITS